MCVIVCVLFVGEVPLEAELMNACVSAYIHLSLCPPRIIFLSAMLLFACIQLSIVSATLYFRLPQYSDIFKYQLLLK